jgi:hypothetical protein
VKYWQSIPQDEVLPEVAHLQRLTLASLIRESRDFSAPPILAEAIQYARRDNAEILDP